MAEPQMPDEIVNWMRQLDWGMHHVYWHATRQWDLLGPEERIQLEAAGQTRANHQEGETGNGWDFLPMHRGMIRLLSAQFPQHSAFFQGWSTPPTAANSTSDPIPNNGQPKEFDPNKIRGIEELQENIGSFANDDSCGLFIETSLRPIPGNPANRSSDSRTGIHNYLHNRFSDSNSPIDLGNPQVNLENQRFWRLHGWIDKRWTAFRTSKALRDDEPSYVAALAAAEEHMSGHHMGVMKAGPLPVVATGHIRNLALAVKRIRLDKAF
jgi:hypothetical protein